MTYLKTMSTAVILSTALATVAPAQETGGTSGQMMDGGAGMSGNMMGGDMSGMQGMMTMMQMMQMMQQMEPMMKACTEMMQAMNDQVQQPSAGADKG